MNRSYVFFADGLEEIEAITPVDVLRRAGLDVKSVSIKKEKEVMGAHGVTVKADLTFDECDFKDADWLILPGGMPGAENLYNYEPLANVLKSHMAAGGRVAAICASPAVVLGQLGLLKGKEATCYPGFETFLADADYKKAAVVSRNNLITANGPGAALKFALAIVAATVNVSEASLISSQMMNN